jgi:PilZ domain
MPSEPGAHESRRSTRVRMKVQIEAKGLTELLACDGETIVVSRHGALILTSVPLRVGMRIEIHVILTDKRALAQVVYIDPEWPRHCGIGL